MTGMRPMLSPSPQTLRAATRLERHVEWSEGFWLAYIFTTSPAQVHILQDRLELALRARASEQRVLRPRDAKALESVLSDVLADRHARCTWVEAIIDVTALEPGVVEWSDAWRRLVLRANERRELLREMMEGGLILVAHPDLKARLRAAGPDLWSIRSFVFELPPGSDDDSATRSVDVFPGPSPAFLDSELLGSDLERLPRVLAQLDLPERAKTLTAVAKRLAAVDRFDESIALQQEVVEIYRSLARADVEAHVILLTIALNDLGRSLIARGEATQAESAFREALAAIEVHDATRRHPETAVSLSGLGDALAQQKMIEEAEHAYRESISIVERLRSPRLDRDMVRSRLALADLLAESQRYGDAEQAYERTLEVGERAYGTREHPEIAAAVRGLAKARAHLGPLRRSEVVPADQRIEEALADMFRIPYQARFIIERLGFPREKIPEFESPLSFWSEVARQARDGVLPGGLQAIVDYVAKMAPRHPVFARYRSRRDSSDNSD